MKRLRSESGFTMIAAVIGTSVIMLMALVAVAAVEGDVNTAQNDLAHKQAFEAAKAGIDYYAFHLNADNAYWTHCTEVPAPSAVNQQGSTANRRPVPGGTGATYAIELIPATGQATCNPKNDETATTSMIEQKGSEAGSFRIRSNGFAENSEVSLIATFKRASFLDYMYFTQLETSDPVTYGNEATVKGAYEQCTLTYQQGRYEKPIPNSGGEFCDKISFISADTIKGPLHTNDALAICGNPTFGRSAADVIEVSSSAPGWFSTCNGSKPTFTGTYITNAPVLTPPPSNSQLATIAEPSFRYEGQVRICLSGTSMTVGTGGTCTGKYSGPIPPNGVIYVKNGTCSSTYTPFETTYPETSGCGNVYVKGSYSGQLTIAAENDIIINGNLTKPESGNGLLGLIANNFVRVYHPCSNNNNLAGSLTNPTIEAAILTINHSFIVDNYNCGEQLGALTVDGAIAQKFRGPVGTFGGGSTGYTKNYIYDDRLRYVEPPDFLEPIQSAWIIGRETVE